MTSIFKAFECEFDDLEKEINKFIHNEKYNNGIIYEVRRIKGDECQKDNPASDLDTYITTNILRYLNNKELLEDKETPNKFKVIVLFDEIRRFTPDEHEDYCIKNERFYYNSLYIRRNRITNKPMIFINNSLIDYDKFIRIVKNETGQYTVFFSDGYSSISNFNFLLDMQQAFKIEGGILIVKQEVYRLLLNPLQEYLNSNQQYLIKYLDR